MEYWWEEYLAKLNRKKYKKMGVYNHTYKAITESSFPNVEEKIDCVYRNHEHHRNGDSDKSQWSISEQEEFQLFQEVCSRIWFLGNYIEDKYVVKYHNGCGWIACNQAVGVTDWKSDKANHCLNVCKFVENVPDEWHGYPANLKKTQDRPCDSVVQMWYEEGLISSPKMKKLKGGKLWML